MAHLRRFRRFIQSETALEIPETVSLAVVPTESTPVKMAQMLPTPSVDQVEYYLAKWDALEDYHLQENALDRLFLTLCPENNNISDILLKVSVLNDFYSTNIFKVFPVAKHMVDGDLVNGVISQFAAVRTELCVTYKTAVAHVIFPPFRRGHGVVSTHGRNGDGTQGRVDSGYSARPSASGVPGSRDHPTAHCSRASGRDAWVCTATVSPRFRV